MEVQKELRMAVARFRGFRSHLHGKIGVSVVTEYHSIIASLESASGADLQAFRIPTRDMNPRLLRDREALRRAGDYEPQFSSVVYCDPTYFKEKMQSLVNFIEHYDQVPG